MTRAEFLATLDWARGRTVVEPPARMSGWWAGAPSAVTHLGDMYLAYRLRRPITAGRGFATVVARVRNGVELDTMAVIERDRHRADSLERPALVRSDDGRWRLYISCATPNSRHWRVDLLEAETIGQLPDATPVTVLPGDESMAVKDPVIRRDQDGWHLWASCHPLGDPDATDRMSTRYARSRDGREWVWEGTAMSATPGTWDARGVRFADVREMSDGFLALYDGRASAAENFEERTGAAFADSLAGPWRPTPGPTFVSPHGTGGLRYLSTTADPDGGLRVFYESARPDGSHELRTQLAPV